MARIRTIKPEFWQDEKLSAMSPLTRLVFLGLISQADDAGRLVDNVKLLDGLLFPLTDDSCAESLVELSESGRIIRYRTASGQKLIQITNWEKHQKVQNPSKHNLPGPDEAIDESRSSVDSTETLRSASRESPSTILDLGSRTIGSKDRLPRARTRESDPAQVIPLRSDRAAPESDLERLADWLGEHEVVQRFAESANHPPTWAVSILGSFGPSGRYLDHFERAPPDRHAIIIVRAMHDYADRGEPYRPTLFRGYVRRAAKADNHARAGVMDEQYAGGTTKFEGLKG